MLTVFLLLALGQDNPANPNAPAYVKAELAALQTTFAVEKFPKVLAGRWADQQIAATDRVYIPAGVTVLIDTTDAVCEAIRVDGTLKFARNVDTKLFVTTIVGPLCSSTLDAGTQADPITAKCEVVFRAKAVDIVEDPREFGTGYVGHRTLVWGKQKTTQADFTSAPVGGTSVSLSVAPTGWSEGDTIVLAGPQGFEQEEKRTITGISGNTVSFAEPLKFSHANPDPKVGPVFAINLTRNIVFRSENPGYGNTVLKAPVATAPAPPVDPVVKQMGHFMVMGCGVGNSQIGYAEFRDLGRTDKRTQLNVVKFRDGKRLLEHNGQPQGINTFGRYSVHFHHGGRQGTPALVKGIAFHGGPGWGAVNHSSNVHWLDCVGYDYPGAVFVPAEIGDEVGLVQNCAAIRSGPGYQQQDGDGDLQANIDLNTGVNGSGFWFQGLRNRIRNIKASNCTAGVTIWTFPGVQVFVPPPPDKGFAQWIQGSIDPADVDPNGPDAYLLKSVDPVTNTITVGSTAADCDGMAILWGAFILSLNNPTEAFGQWKNLRIGGTTMPYSFNQRFADSYFSAGPKMQLGYIHALRFNFCTHTIEYDNCEVFNFGQWIAGVPPGYNVIRNCKSNSPILCDQNSWANICNINFRPKETWFENTQSPISWTGESGLIPNRVIVDGKQLYGPKSEADFVPFPTVNAEYTPPYYAGKTNRQLMDEYGVAVSGDITPPDAVFDAKYGHKVGPISKRLAVVARNSHQDLTLKRPSGAVAKIPIEVYPLKQHAPTMVNVDHPVKPGWQPVFFTYEGQRYSVNVFGTGSTPPPEPPVPPPLVVTTVEVSPANLTLEVGKTAQLSAVVKDQFGAVMPGKGVVWSSSNGSVATVQSSGAVAAIASGNAVITATADGKQGAANVTVSSPQPTPKTVKKVTVEFSDGSKVELP